MKQGVFSLARQVWSHVPIAMRQSPAVLRAATRLRAWLASDSGPVPPQPFARPSLSPQIDVTPAEVPSPAAPECVDGGMRVLRTLEELDAMLVRLEAAAAVSDDELRRGFASFRMEFPLALPEDPDSPAWRDAQMRLYEWLHGKPYAVINEVSAFDVEAAARAPFPYQTHSADTVGHQLIAVGHVVRTLGLAAGQSVIEFGPGWGNTTIALARMGCQVTAVDIEPNFLALIERRAAAKGLAIELIRGDFALAQTLDRRFDAVLFFECFHHCAEHQALVAALDRIVAPGGKVVFAAEPILDEFPIAWGLRLDGESLWAIRRNGWLELGFQETYFRGLLDRHGWRVDKTVCAETPWGVTYTARRKTEA